MAFPDASPSELVTQSKEVVVSRSRASYRPSNRPLHGPPPKGSTIIPVPALLNLSREDLGKQSGVEFLWHIGPPADMTSHTHTFLHSLFLMNNQR